MPAEGDLGVSYLAVVLVVLVGQVVIGLVVRRKWRISAARREEIKRLLVLASEEAARAELEASFGYDVTPAAISPPLQYQCAVCFCPTTTRCARCKAVRYCSGKCQIIHWRQGHREECRPFTSSYESNDEGGGSCQKLLKQEENKINGNSFETDGRSYAKSGHNFPEEPAYSNSPENERSDGRQSTSIYPDKLEAGRVNNVDENGRPSSKSAASLDSLDGLTSSGKLNQIEPGCTDHDSQCGSTSSSGWSADGSNESSFSEPSTPSSGFWDGTLNFSKPKVDAIDDSAESSSSSTGEADLQNSQSSSFPFQLHKNAVPPVIEQGSGAKPVILDEHNSTALKIKEPFKRSVLSQEISKNVSKDKSSLLLSLNRSDMDDYASSDSPESKSKEPRYCSASTYAYPTSSAGRPSISTHASKVSSMCSLKPERSNHVVNDTSTTSHPVECKEGRSLSPSASVAHLSSSTGRRSLQGAKPGKIETAHAIASTSENGWYSPNARNGLKTSPLKVVDQLRAPASSRHCQSEVASEITRRYNIKGLFPYEVFVKLYNWNKGELRPFGLTNCGNSCYANAVLQCLACTPPLTAYLLEGIHRKTCERKEWCFTCEFESLILKAKEGTSPLSPLGILSQIQNIGRHLGNGREEDAHEFLRSAIETMQSVCLKEARVNASSSLEEETSLIGLTFGGYLRSKIKCLKCGGKSERHERMMDLTVEIEGDIGTLEEALRQFTGTEILDGENKYQCSRCRSYERAKKKLTVQEAPNILTIALKRFQSGKFGKLNKSIRFPEILDLAPYMSRTSDKSPVYRLYGVVVHLDLMNASFSGHYVCYIKNAQKKWFKIDDSMVTAVELGSVLAERAYMLLYARCSPRAPRLLRDSIIPRDPRKPKTPASKSRATPTSPRDASTADPSSGRPGIECLYPNHASFQPTRKNLEEDSSSENSSSIFSEECSCSTGSSSNRYSSDSDSTSSPSPSYSRHSPLADSDRYSSRKPDTSNGFWARQPNGSSNSEGKSCVPILNSDITKPCRKVERSSSSCRRETDSGRLGWANSKSDGVTFGRTD